MCFITCIFSVFGNALLCTERSVFFFNVMGDFLDFQRISLLFIYTTPDQAEDIFTDKLHMFCLCFSLWLQINSISLCFPSVMWELKHRILG